MPSQRGPGSRALDDPDRQTAPDVKLRRPPMEQRILHMERGDSAVGSSGTDATTALSHRLRRAAVHRRTNELSRAIFAALSPSEQEKWPLLDLLSL